MRVVNGSMPLSSTIFVWRMMRTLDTLKKVFQNFLCRCSFVYSNCWNGYQSLKSSLIKRRKAKATHFRGVAEWFNALPWKGNVRRKSGQGFKSLSLYHFLVSSAHRRAACLENKSWHLSRAKGSIPLLTAMEGKLVRVSDFFAKEWEHLRRVCVSSTLPSTTLHGDV